MRRLLISASLLIGFAVFCVVQDRVTAAGARRYVALQQDAAAAGRAPVPVEAVMAPAIAESRRAGLMWGGGVVLVGLAAAAIAGRRQAAAG
jgi:hypothetical protein